MSCDCSKDCHQNSSFIFGIVIGLIIAAVVAIVIYKNNRQDVLVKLKKQIEKFFSAIGRPASSGKTKSTKTVKPFVAPNQPKNKKKEVTIPDNLIIADLTAKPTPSRPKKMFKK